MKKYYDWPLKTRLWFFVRDLFMPRYALVVELHDMPNLEYMFDHKAKPYITVPVIMRVPYKRPFLMPYNFFVNNIKEEFGIQTLIFFATRFTLYDLSRSIGSAMSHNVANAVIYDPKPKTPECPICEASPTEHCDAGLHG